MWPRPKGRQKKEKNRLLSPPIKAEFESIIKAKNKRSGTSPSANQGAAKKGGKLDEVILWQ